MKKLFITLIFFSSVYSTLTAGGVFLYEVATPDLGTASAGWSARAQDAATLFTNPAGMTRLKRPQLMVGLEPIYNHIKFRPNSSTTVRGSNGNASAWIPSGSMFFTTPITERISVGVGGVGYWGSTLNFGRHWVGRYYLKNITLQGFSALPAAAFKLTDKLSVGVSCNLMLGILRQKSAVRNFLDGGKDGQMKLRDNKFKAGWIVGALYEFNSKTRVGIQYISQVKLKFHDKPKFKNLGPLLTDAIRLSGISIDDVKLTIKVPHTLIASIYHEVTPKLALLANIGWQQWAKFNKAEISLSNFPVSSISVQGKYKNTWHSALGMQYQLTPVWRLSCGIACDRSAVSKKHRTLSFPVGEQWRYGAGCQYTYSENVQINAGYELMWSGKLHIDENLGPLAGRVAGHFRRASAQFFALSLTRTF